MELSLRFFPNHLMILSWRGLKVNFFGRGISLVRPEGSIHSLCLLEIIWYLIGHHDSHADCDFHNSVKVSILFTAPCCLSSSVGPMPDISWPHPKPSSCCRCTSPFLALSILQHCPAGVRKLMALSWVLTINQVPISQAHIKLWTNGYTGMRGPVRTRMFQWRDRTGYKGTLVGQGQGEVTVLKLIYTVSFRGSVCDTCL